MTYVKWNGRAAKLGLEPGDVILSMNGIPLTYHGSWNDALRQAILNGGWVQLRIRDVNTGHVAFRQTFVGGNCYGGPIQHYNVGYPVGPNTSHVHHYNGNNNGVTVLDIVKLLHGQKEEQAVTNRQSMAMRKKPRPEAVAFFTRVLVFTLPYISPHLIFFFFLVRRYSIDFASPRVRKSLAGPRLVDGGGAIFIWISPRGWDKIRRG